MTFHISIDDKDLVAMETFLSSHPNLVNTQDPVTGANITVRKHATIEDYFRELISAEVAVRKRMYPDAALRAKAQQVEELKREIEQQSRPGNVTVTRPGR